MLSTLRFGCLSALVLSIFSGVEADASRLCRGLVGGLPEGARYQLKIGDSFKVHFEGAQEVPRDVHFLGASRIINGEIAGYFFFDAAKMEIHYIPKPRMDLLDERSQQVIDATKLEPVVRSINQEGGTCAAYAIFNCFHQLLAINQLGNGTIVHRMVDEPSRVKFYTRLNNEYYADDSHIGTESEIAGELGYVVSNLNSASPLDLANSIRHSSSMDWPMLIRFDVGQRMAETPYVIHNHEMGSTADRRLWLPKDTSGSNGGHQIVVLRSFVDLRGQEWLVVVDSNWRAPRLWAIQELNKAAIAQIRGWTVWQDKPNPSSLPPPLNTPFVVETPDLTAPNGF